MNPSLSKRLLLSLVPLLALPLVFLWNLIGDGLAIVLALGTYFLLTGFCVLAPLATGSRIALRVLLLAVAPLLVSFFSIPLGYADISWDEGIYLPLVVAGGLYTLIVAIIAARCAPLKTRPRYWLFAGLTGALTGLSLAYFFEELFCLFFCSTPDWYVWLILVPVTAWPVLLCLTVHFGRSADDPGSTAEVTLPVSRRFGVGSLAALVIVALLSAAAFVWSDMYRSRAVSAYIDALGADPDAHIWDLAARAQFRVSDMEAQLNLVLAREAHKNDPAWLEEHQDAAGNNDSVARALQLSVAEAEAELAAARLQEKEIQAISVAADRNDAFVALSLVAASAALLWNLFWRVANRAAASR